MMLRINPWLTLLTIVMVPLSPIAALGVMKSSAKHFGNQQELLGKMNGFIEEMYNGQSVVQTFNYQERAKREFEELNRKLQNSSQSAEIASGKISPITSLVNNVGYAFSAVIGCLFVLSGRMTVGNVTVEPGQKVAIVGPTGAGKTTLINLLMRFYEINSGEILVDGVNTKEMTRKELRNHFGMVLQDTWLFEGSIMENLAYSRDGLTENEIVAASKAACADGFIRTMPGAYDMELSKGAENISQGERQLLTIARAMASNPEIMILDEATSNVDTHTEQKIQQAMAQLMKGRTSFVIAHRLSTIKDADMILYMENGDIKEVGNHDSLMELNGKYAMLYNSQFA